MSYPLCVDCKHYKKNKTLGDRYASCESPKNKIKSLVSGKTEYKHWKYCNVQRFHSVLKYDCGEEGRWFEPKEPEKPKASLFTKIKIYIQNMQKGM